MKKKKILNRRRSRSFKAMHRSRPRSEFSFRHSSVVRNRRPEIAAVDSNLLRSSDLSAIRVASDHRIRFHRIAFRRRGTTHHSSLLQLQQPVLFPQRRILDRKSGYEGISIFRRNFTVHVIQRISVSVCERRIEHLSERNNSETSFFVGNVDPDRLGVFQCAFGCFDLLACSSFIWKSSNDIIYLNINSPLQN